MMFVRNDCKVKTRDAVSLRVYNRRPFKAPLQSEHYHLVFINHQ